MTIPGTSGPLVAALLLVPGPPAVAQDRGSDEREVLAVAEAALTAFTEEDMIALTDLMIDEALIFSVSGQGENLTYSARTRAEERGRSLTRDIVERGFDAQVQIAGGLATVWLPYDLYVDGDWSHCGVDVFAMVRFESEWRIASMGWSVEQPPACEQHPAGPPGRR